MYFVYDSPLGEISVVSDGKAITHLSIAGQTPVTDGDEVRWEDYEILGLAKSWLDQYFRGEAPSIELPLSIEGSQFAREVYDILLDIPYGQITTYSDIARRIARNRGIERMSAQAVGGAVGRNPISIIVPCHRVVGVGGALTGYAGGLHLKRRLLEIEGVDVSIPGQVRGNRRGQS